MFEILEGLPEPKYLPLPPRDECDGDGIELVAVLVGLTLEEILADPCPVSKYLNFQRLPLPVPLAALRPIDNHSAFLEFRQNVGFDVILPIGLLE